MIKNRRHSDTRHLHKFPRPKIFAQAFLPVTSNITRQWHKSEKTMGDEARRVAYYINHISSLMQPILQVAALSSPDATKKQTPIPQKTTAKC